MQTNKTSQYNNLGKPTLVENIISNVKQKMNDNLKMYLIIAIPILFFLAFVLYKYNFVSRSNNVITNMGYKNKIELQPIPECYNVDIRQQYKLCDYYITF